MKRILSCLAILAANTTVLCAGTFTFVYNDWFNSPNGNDSHQSAIYPDGTNISQATPFPSATAFEVVATFDSAVPDTSHQISYQGLQVYTPLSAKLIVYTASGPQTYTFVQGFVSPYHNNPGENQNDTNNTDVAIFDSSSPNGSGHIAIGLIEDPWLDGAGFVADFSDPGTTANFSVANLRPYTFSAYQGTGFDPGPQYPFLCSDNGTTCTAQYVEPIKLQGSDGNYYWLALSSGDTLGAHYKASASLTNALRFQPLTPCRVVDTRKSGGGGTLATGETRDIDFLNSACSVPGTALAYSINATVVPQGPLGYLTAFPKGILAPVASTLNSLDGRVKSNAAVVLAGDSGKVSFFASNPTDLVVDINGYFVAASDPTALQFYPLTPCRVVDTRKAAGTFGAPSLQGGVARNFPILNSSCSVPQGAQAYALNYTVVPQGELGYLTTWPGGSSTQPLVSTLNATTGIVTANAAIVQAGSDGSVNVFASNNTDFVMDITGYFAPAGANGQSLYGMVPCRVLDSRLNGGLPLTAATTVSFGASQCGLPADSQAFVTNATAVPTAGLGYLTLWPDGATQPIVSTLNAVDGTVTSNLAIVPTTNGSIDVFGSNPTQVVLDTFGYFAP